MIIDDIEILISEVEVINEINAQFTKPVIDGITRSVSMTAFSGASKYVTDKAISSGIENTLLRGFLGALGGSLFSGVITSLVVGLLGSILKDKNELAQYQQQAAQEQEPEKKQQLQEKIKEKQIKIANKRTKLNQEKIKLAKSNIELRKRISEMEQNKSKLSATDLINLEKYKKLLVNREKALTKLNV